VISFNSSLEYVLIPKIGTKTVSKKKRGCPERTAPY
jgi:hypothetical protein